MHDLIVFTIGRMNPPTTGHLKLLQTAMDLANKNNAKFVSWITKTQNAKANPLDPITKIQILNQLFPRIDFVLVQDAFVACRQMASWGHSKAIIVVGSDREFDLIDGLRKYINHPDTEKTIGLKELSICVVSRTSDDASSTMARTLAVKGDFASFKALIPSDDINVSTRIYNQVRIGMGIQNEQ